MPAVLALRHHPLPAAAVPHLHPAGRQPLLPLRRQRGLHQRGVSVGSRGCTVVQMNRPRFVWMLETAAELMTE